MTSKFCSHKCTPFLLLFVSISFLITSVLVAFIVPIFIQWSIAKSLPLLNTADSRTYDKWQKIPVPITTKFYIFNITNPQDVEEFGKTPIMEELGPYVYTEYREKIDIQYSQNDNIVGYGQKRIWKFEPHLTKGSLDDLVYHLNVPMVAAGADVAKRNSSFMFYAINRMIKLTGSRLVPHHTVAELLFEGYEDPLITESRKIGMPVPFDKFGWFYGRNNTVSDGYFQIKTGKDDLNELDEMYSWKGNTTLNLWWGDKCNSLNNISASDFQAPFQTKPRDYIEIFVGDICRPLKLPYKDTVFKQGVKSYRYMASSDLFSYSVKENLCYCPASNPLSCPPSGVADISPCQHGSPSAASLPHFLFGDPVLFERIRGLTPNPKLHEFYMDIEPTLGVATTVRVSMQINVNLQRFEKLDYAKNLPFANTFYPMIWFDAGASLDSSMAGQLRLLQNLPQIMNLMAGIFASVGFVVFFTTCIVFRSKYWPKTDMNLVPTQESD